MIVGFIDRESQLGRKYLEKSKTDVFYKHATFYSSHEVHRVFQESNFSDIEFSQTLLPDKPITLIKEGFGEGSFVVTRGQKT